jgi:hypothetical protein
MTKLIAGVAAVLAASSIVAPAAADPTQQPSPPYVIQTPAGPVYGGMRTLPPICGAQPRACSGTWDPNLGTWVFPQGTGSS